MHRFLGLILLCCAMHCVSAARLPRDFLDISADDTGSTLDLSSLGGLGSIVSFVKFQFRDIIEEICVHALKYLKEILHHFKVKLLKKMGKYTLSNIFHAVFDGVTDFVVESSTDLSEETAPVASDSVYGYYSPNQWRDVEEEEE